MPRGATSLVLRPVGETWSRYGDICCPTVPFVTWNATDGRWNAFHSTARFYASFHLIEQPIDGFWSAGARLLLPYRTGLPGGQIG